MHLKKIAILTVFVFAVATAYSDVFGTGSNQFSMAFTDIDHPGNTGDVGNVVNSNYPGSVAYSYRMGVTEVSIDQFAKAMAYDSRISHVDGTTNHHDYTYWNAGDRTVGPGAPVAFCSWYEGARFANWLTSGDAYAGVYQFDTNGTLVAVDRLAAMISYGTIYVLPTEDEWYKAAYYRPVNDGSYSLYSTGDSSHPLQGTTNGWNYLLSYPTNGTVYPPPNYTWESGFGGVEQNGTHDMGGNIWEWCENAFDGELDNLDEGRVIRGGSALDTVDAMKASLRHAAYSPENTHKQIGLRIASLEPFIYQVLIATNGNGSVNITNGLYAAGTNLSLVASPDTNWLFMGWSGDLVGDYTTASTNLFVAGNISVTATFSEDADGDGLLNVDEAGLGTDPRDPDTDHDLISDGQEAAAGLDPLVSNAGSDSDGDGLPDEDEVTVHGTDPLNADTDGDAMPDGWEVGYGLGALTNSALVDTDTDGLADLGEFALGGDPTNSLDAGYAPGFIVAQVGGTNYLDYIHARLTNAAAFGLAYDVERGPDGLVWTNVGYAVTGTTGLSNGFESVTNRIDAWTSSNLYLRVAITSSNAVVYSALTQLSQLELWAGGYGLYGTNALASIDIDGDGLDNVAEFNAGTDPLNADTDGDAMPDGWEVGYGLGALTNSALFDTDTDGLADLGEFAMGGDPTNGLDTGYAPGFVVAQIAGTNHLDYIHAQLTNAEAYGFAYDVEQGPDGLVWTNVGYTVTGTAGLTNGIESVTNRIDAWTSSNLYLRVAVSTSNAVVYSALTQLSQLDLWAGGYGLYGTNALASADTDGDGLDNAAEFNAGTNPTLTDSDGDGLSDGQETATGLDPLVSNAGSDRDGDGLLDVAEVNVHGTDPLHGDTDADSFGDGVEVANGGDPLVSDLWRVDYIRNHGSMYDLYSSNSVVDISIGQAAFAVSNGEASLLLQLEQSDDLTTWTNAGSAVIWSIPLETNTSFYRVRSGN